MAGMLTGAPVGVVASRSSERARPVARCEAGAREAGFDLHLVKPVKPDGFSRHLSEL